MAQPWWARLFTKARKLAATGKAKGLRLKRPEEGFRLLAVDAHSKMFNQGKLGKHWSSAPRQHPQKAATAALKADMLKVARRTSAASCPRSRPLQLARLLLALPLPRLWAPGSSRIAPRAPRGSQRSWRGTAVACSGREVRKVARTFPLCRAHTCGSRSRWSAVSTRMGTSMARSV